MSDTALLPAESPRTERRPRPKRQPRYHVVLLDDDDHTYDYVIRLLRTVFGYPAERGWTMAKEVDDEGRVILLTTTLEHAELKQEQVHAFGADPLIGRSEGAMTAMLEPAP